MTTKIWVVFDTDRKGEPLGTVVSTTDEPTAKRWQDEINNKEWGKVVMRVYNVYNGAVIAEHN